MISNINYTIRYNLCCGCGICESACHSNAISITLKQGRFIPKVDEAKCKCCHRCLKVCPGIGVALRRMADEFFTDPGILIDQMAGLYLKCFTGHSNDLNTRYHCSSGGMVSEFLIFLLEKNYIDGAVVTAFSPNNEFLVHSYIAHCREDVLRGKGSKYAPVSMHGIAQAIKKQKGTKFVIVGLPCHVHGFRKLEGIDLAFKRKIIGYFSLYCSSGRTFYLTEHVFRERNIRKEELTYFAYRDEGCLGSMVAKRRRISLYDKDKVYKERYQSYYHPLRSFFIPRRCLFCIDHYGELGDVCFGDIHVEPYIKDTVGVNSLIVRQKLWLDWLMKAKKDGRITLDEISVELLNSSQKMVYKKKYRNSAFIDLNKAFGRPVPTYDVGCLRKHTVKTFVDYVQNRAQQFLGRQKSLWWLVTLLKQDASKLK